ncbi:MAG: peptidylprolyl isomerase [Candidatus Aadella gelida]|nr:peptidylprolyl isomerase [Candidatus Aadella gelida]
MKRYIILSILIVCVFMLTNRPGFCPAQEKPPQEDVIIAQVGDTTIHFSEIIKVADKLNRFLKENFYNSETWRMNFIKQYIVQTALAKRAIEEGLDKDKKIVFELDNVKNSILADKILEKKVSEIALTEQDFKDHYDTNKEKYTTKKRVKIDYAGFDSRKKAKRAIAKLNNGKGLEEITQKDDGVDKKETWITEDSPGMNPEIDGILDSSAEIDIVAQEVGTISDIREKDGKFYVIIVREKEPARLRPYDEVERQVISEKQRIEKEKSINAFISETFDKVGIKIYEENMTLNDQSRKNHPINKIRS